ncbi:ChrR family anti-sigma-E factor [Rhizobium sp. C4]|uniref:ChrR family anti-sigma-E factor n=1 Tax=Rhizobium sp. C4 TaxID=1349800 RepID=UPI001E55F52A|nr:ChrR family anti-sigma-E factor [Rhizobium sp. C4]MCD2173445.1 ChrR family anti-sigma-E factor [Rhizobium sp. C4]
MNIHHHISDELLFDYANGALEEGWSLAVATHLALCPSCRKRLAAMEAAGGAIFEAIEVEPASASKEDFSWEAMRARIDNAAPVREVPAAKVVSARDGVLVPEPLRSYIGGDVDKVKWKPLGLGAYHYPIKTSDEDISVRLLRIPAGKPVPEHTHGGRELTLVLKGSFSDVSGRFGPGDFEETDETVDHQPIADPGEDCICLAVTDAPLKFKSRIVRMIQPLLGI